MTPGFALNVSGVSHHWRDHLQVRDALQELSATFHAGSPHFICGPSGAGKSTLGLIMAGLVKPDRGRIELHGKPLAEQRRRIAYLFQFPESIFFADTVEKELLDVCGTADGSIWEPHFDSLGLSLPGILHRQPFTLSEGYARLTALAIQFARNPDVLIADEPTIGLDWRHQERVIEALHAWIAPGRILAVITHDLDLISRLDGTSWVLTSGRLTWNGATADLLASDELLTGAALLA